MTWLIALLKENAGKSVSVGVIVSLVMLGLGAKELLDERYALASEQEQVQRSINDYKRDQIEDQLLIWKMKEEGASEEAINAALKEKYLRRLERLNKEENEKD
jgi:hypothetical protein